MLRQSITELCVEDHRGDPAQIAAWLASEIPTAWSPWAAHPVAALLVAERSGILVGVGMVRADGEVLLTYASPGARFGNVSKALLKAMEANAASRGTRTSTVESTATALRLYRAMGYAPVDGVGPMRLPKPLP